MYTICY